jgi:hypothetical protein
MVIAAAGLAAAVALIDIPTDSADPGRLIGGEDLFAAPPPISASTFPLLPPSLVPPGSSTPVPTDPPATPASLLPFWVQPPPTVTKASSPAVRVLGTTSMSRPLTATTDPPAAKPKPAPTKTKLRTKMKPKPLPTAPQSKPRPAKPKPRPTPTKPGPKSEPKPRRPPTKPEPEPRPAKPKPKKETKSEDSLKTSSAGSSPRSIAQRLMTRAPRRGAQQDTADRGVAVDAALLPVEGSGPRHVAMAGASKAVSQRNAALA